MKKAMVMIVTVLLVVGIVGAGMYSYDRSNYKKAVSNCEDFFGGYDYAQEKTPSVIRCEHGKVFCYDYTADVVIGSSDSYTGRPVHCGVSGHVGY